MHAVPNHKRTGTSTYDLLLLPQQLKMHLARGQESTNPTAWTTFSNFGDEVGMEGNLGNCYDRFASRTGVHQGAHICHAK